MSGEDSGNYDRFELEEEIGHGASGTVYRARDRLLGTPVAVKILRTPFADHALRRFIVEAEIGQSLTHPNIIRIHGIDHLADGTPAIVMEYVKGASLAARMTNTGCQLSFAEVLELLRSVAEGLAHAHSLGVIHRDLKPSNILIGEDGVVRLADFGAARIERADESLTLSGELVGTPAYMAPEILRGEPATVQSDIYSFGMIAQELRCGLSANRTSPKMTPRAGVVLGAPEWFCRFVRQCTAPHPGDRYRSMRDIIRVLASPSSRGRLERARRIGRRAVLGSLTAMLVLVIAAQVSDRMLIRIAPPLHRLIGSENLTLADEGALRLLSRAEVAAAMVTLGQREGLEGIYQREISSPALRPLAESRLLCAAAAGEHPEILQLMLDHVPRPDQECRGSHDEHNAIPLLSVAIAMNRPANVAILLDRGASFSHPITTSGHPFMILMREGDGVMLKTFFTHARVRRTPVIGQTPMLVVMIESPRVRELIDSYLMSGAPVTLADAGAGLTALHVAALTCNSEVVEQLLDGHVPVDFRAHDGETPFSSMCVAPGTNRTSGDAERVYRALKKAGGDPNSAAYNGATLLMLAVVRHRTDLVQLLLRDPEVRVDSGDRNSDTALAHAVNSYNSDPAIIDMLLSAGADPLRKNVDGISPLENARRRNDPALLRSFEPFMSGRGPMGISASAR